jgi:uncharacterized PurR-regulated membrane protein YhhQ (DUF165 family)
MIRPAVQFKTVTCEVLATSPAQFHNRFPMPFSFLDVDLANRYHGPRMARRIVYVGFVVALVPFRVALALVRPRARRRRVRWGALRRA